MKGWGFRIQIGSTHAEVRVWPFYWEVYTSAMNPKRYGFGVWLVHDLWAGGSTDD